MRRIIKKTPLAIAGLMLALAALGNLIQSYGDIYRNVFGFISSILLLLILSKLVFYPGDIKKELDNPLVASVFPTFTMGIMLLATYLKEFNSYLAFIIWIIALTGHLALIFIFSKNHILNFNIKKVFPSWFIVYVGIVTASVSSPAFEMQTLGKVLFYFGLVSYLIILPLVIKRIQSIKIPEPALPTLAIFAAPLSLSLAGYMSAFQTKNMLIVWTLLVLSQLSYFLVLLQMPKLLRLKFYPSYSAFTFPLVISAISIKLTNGYLVKKQQIIPLLKYIVKFEEIIAISIVLYVLVSYIIFLSKTRKVE